MSELLGREKLSILFTPAEIHQSPDGAAGRSDHASFQYRGYGACVTTEDFFPTPAVPEFERNPNYHKATDRFIDLAFATSIARVVCAAGALRVSDPEPAGGPAQASHCRKEAIMMPRSYASKPIMDMEHDHPAPPRRSGFSTNRITMPSSCWGKRSSSRPISPSSGARCTCTSLS